MGQSDKSRESGATRRKVLKATGIAGLGAIILPSSWTKPILRSVVVPAHAQTTPEATTTTTTTKKKDRPKRTTPRPTTTNTSTAPF